MDTPETPILQGFFTFLDARIASELSRHLTWMNWAETALPASRSPIWFRPSNTHFPPPCVFHL